jgi:Secretion system C-terminal sorting domain
LLSHYCLYFCEINFCVFLKFIEKHLFSKKTNSQNSENMKKLLLIVLLLIITTAVKAQGIKFEYDLAGNQIHRTYCSNCRYANQSQPIKNFEDLEAFAGDVLSYYPNPVKDELFLKWEMIDENKVVSIELFSTSGQMMKQITIKNRQQSETISFQALAAGIYFVSLNYSDGNQKQIKIVKK